MDAPPVPLPLDAVTIDRWAGTWDDGGLWADVQALAGRYTAAAVEHGPHAAAVVDRWHHLLLAVGNFKRQGNRRLKIRLAPPRRRAVRP